MWARAAEAVAVSAMATIVTVVLAAPVLRAPSDRVFGMEIVGRHHDPFTAMQQFGRPISVGLYSQPVTDIAGALLARLSDPVAAYNWLILLSFPLSAAAAYLLARHLQLSPAGATLAALAFAFSPFHLAHAAYHPHIAQTQWIPLYLLALWRCLDDATPAAVGFLVAATTAVTLSNFYGGLIAAAITPVALGAYWLVTRREHARPARRLAITVGTLVCIAAAGMTYAYYFARAVVVDRAAFGFPRIDLFHYSARWWSYLVPPVEHQWLGAAAQRVWSAAGVRDGLLEQQVSLGWGVVALGLVAVLGGLRPARDRQHASRARVPILMTVAAAALVCSLSPERTIGGITLAGPSALLYGVVPMFRSYARFGVVVQLMAVLLAGIGVDCLLRPGMRRARIACIALVALAVWEYSVAPSTMWRDVLPTTAHRWVAQQPGPLRALDCMPLNRESQPVQWLTGYRVMMLESSTGDCTEPNLPQKLAATGYTHLLVRRETADGRWFARHAAMDGLRVAANFDDGQVFAVTARMPAIYTAAIAGFFGREHDAKWTWRWMGKDATWTVVNTRAQPVVTTLVVELSAFRHARGMDVRLDGQHVRALVVERSRHVYEIGPLTVMPGDHEIGFHAADESTVADDAIGNGDYRRLSLAVGSWKWNVQADQP